MIPSSAIFMRWHYINRRYGRVVASSFRHYGYNKKVCSLLVFCLCPTCSQTCMHGVHERNFFLHSSEKIYINCIDGNSSLLIQRTQAHTLSMFEAFWSFISVMIDAEQGEKLSKDEKSESWKPSSLIYREKQMFSIVSLFVRIAMQKPRHQET